MHWLSALQYMDIKSYLPNDILTKVDRMSMAHSIEARVPLLDHKFVEFAATIPPEMKLKGNDNQVHIQKGDGRHFAERHSVSAEARFCRPFRPLVPRATRVFTSAICSCREKVSSEAFSERHISSD